MAHRLAKDPSDTVAAFVWRNIVLLCDDGRTSAADYAGLLALGRSVESEFPAGFGVLIVIPPNAVPPSEDVRKAINHTLEELQGSIRCMCWMIEGSGFQAAMVRAVLTGMRLIGRTPYTRHVSVDLTHALAWMMSQLNAGSPRLDLVPEAVAFVRARLEGVRTSRVYSKPQR